MSDRRPPPPPNKKFLVAGIGEVVWDIYPGERRPGGTPTNVAIHACQLGDQGVLISRLGADDLGRALRDALKQRGLAPHYLQSDPFLPTGTVRVTLDEQGRPSFRCSNKVAFEALEFTPALAALATRCDAVFFTMLGQRSATAARAINSFVSTARQAIKVLNANVRAPVGVLRQTLPPALHLANIVTLNSEELRWIREALGQPNENEQQFIRQMIQEYNLALVAVTRGALGCELFKGNEHQSFAGLAVKVVDTTGAGDAFAAALIHRYLRGASLFELGSYANRVAAAACTKPGANPLLAGEEIAYQPTATQNEPPRPERRSR